MLMHFNPRAPCGARLDQIPRALAHAVISTHAPLAGRDCTASPAQRQRLDFNPRAPCGARHQEPYVITELDAFQPTRPLRGATVRLMVSL